MAGSRGDNREAEALIDAVYATIESAEAWREVVPRVARWLGAESALLFTPWEADPSRAFGVTHNIPEERLRDYAAYYHAHDVWKDAAERRGLLRAGAQFLSHRVLPVNEMLRSEIYADLWRPLDIGHMLCALLTDDRHEATAPAIALSLFRRLDKGGFSDAEAGRSEAIMPHVRRSLLAARRLEAARALLDSYEASLRASGEAVLLLTPELRVLHASGEPAEIFGRDGVLRIAQGRLGADDAGVRRQLELAARDAAAGRPRGALRVGGAGATQIEIAVMPWRPGRLLARVRALGRSAAGGVARVAERHRLTEAERRVLALLADGAGVADIAAALAIRPMTVRKHLASLFEKTGERSQRALVALVWRHA
ncbi:MAG TPA: helix-turn-helix transcriptional regulator [Burkholderiales bacterium]